MSYTQTGGGGMTYTQTGGGAMTYTQTGGGCQGETNYFEQIEQYQEAESCGEMFEVCSEAAAECIPKDQQVEYYVEEYYVEEEEPHHEEISYYEEIEYYEEEDLSQHHSQHPDENQEDLRKRK